MYCQAIVERKYFGKNVRSPKAPDLFSSALLSVAVRWQQCHEDTSSYYWIPQKRKRSCKSAQTLGNSSMLYHRGEGRKEYRSTYIYEVTSLDHEILYHPKEVKQHLVAKGLKKPSVS